VQRKGNGYENIFSHYQFRLLAADRRILFVLIYIWIIERRLKRLESAHLTEKSKVGALIFVYGSD
jgi:hypothetical protein